MHATHPLILAIICAKHRKNPSRIVCAVERTTDATYFSSFIAKSWLNDLEDIGQGQRSLCTTYPLMLVVICACYRKKPSRTVTVTERTWKGPRSQPACYRATIYPPTTTSLCLGYNYLTQWWLFVNCTLIRNKHQWNSNLNTMVFIHENVVCKIWAICWWGLVLFAGEVLLRVEQTLVPAIHSTRAGQGAGKRKTLPAPAHYNSWEPPLSRLLGGMVKQLMSSIKLR